MVEILPRTIRRVEPQSINTSSLSKSDPPPPAFIGPVVSVQIIELSVEAKQAGRGSLQSYNAGMGRESICYHPSHFDLHTLISALGFYNDSLPQ